MKQFKYFTIIIGAILLIFLAYIQIFQIYPKTVSNFNKFSPSPTISSTPYPSPTPTPSPLTFAQMNQLYGPCIFVPTLMYHHIENMDQAKINNYVNLTVSDSIFRQQMQYLHDAGYSVIKMDDIVNYFDYGTEIPLKSVLLTFDDGYKDNNHIAFPILKEFNYPATIFLSTGLMDNPNYLNWQQINDMNNSGLILFANHTWSHKNMGTTLDIVAMEISQAENQLQEHHLNQLKIFAYPYGLSSFNSIKYLSENEYKLAFTTNPRSILCKQLRFELPRIRIGNSNLNNYGF